MEEQGKRKTWVGIDGGGTKTVAVCVDANGSVIARGTSGCTNKNSVGVETAKTNLQEAVRLALENSGCTSDQVVAVCVGASGVDREADKEEMRQWLAPLVDSTTAIHIHNDAVAALAGGTGGELFGVVVISGTGCIALGYNKAGDKARASGWGPLLGDEGGGYQIGQAILKAVTWAEDGTAPATLLTEAVLQQLGLNAVEELIPWAYQDTKWERFAKLAPLAAKCARQGDAVAEQILEQQSEGLANSAEAVIKKLGLGAEGFPLVLHGGNFTHEGSVLAQKFKTKMLQRYPKACPIIPSCSAEVAAALLALKL
ncbi:N-acetyl-D-glucosamine kinase [Balamuthia mandrillaris]